MDESDKKFKVTDRRRFDSLGGEKSEANESRMEQPKEAKLNHTESDKISQFAHASENEGEVDMAFISLVHSLGAQAMMQLGELPPPDGVPVPKDVVAAKQSIDWLEMIFLKTKGNLIQQESYFLEELLHSLRLSYLKNK